MPASAQISVGVRLPSVRIGINIPLHPQLVAVPGYPVSYAPDRIADATARVHLDALACDVAAVIDLDVDGILGLGSAVAVRSKR